MCLIELFKILALIISGSTANEYFFLFIFGIKLGHVWDLPTSYFSGT
jgi:hypothetical protein